MKSFIVRVIIPDGKGKKVIEEEVIAASYSKDEANNLTFVDEFHRYVIEYHSFNWLSVRGTDHNGGVLPYEVENS